MVDFSWFLFIVASLVLILTDGGKTWCCSCRAALGAAAGVAVALGVSVGLLRIKGKGAEVAFQTSSKRPLLRMVLDGALSNVSNARRQN